MHNLDLKCLLTLSFGLVLGLCQSLERADFHKPTGARRSRYKPAAPLCKPCDLKNCATDVTPETCVGTVVKDLCNCCPMCETSVLSAPPVQPTTPATVSNITGNPCNGIKCPKKQICMLNIQDIPMCRCPSVFYCRRNTALEDPNPSNWRRKRKGSEVCGEDDNTYKSRCYLRIAECTRGSKIKVKHRGACMKSSPVRGVTPTSFPINPQNNVARTKPIKHIQQIPDSPTLSKKQRRKLQRRQRKQKKKDKLARKKNRPDIREERKRNKNKGGKKNRKRARKWRQRRRARQMQRWALA